MPQPPDSISPKTPSRQIIAAGLVLILLISAVLFVQTRRPGVPLPAAAVSSSTASLTPPAAGTAQAAPQSVPVISLQTIPYLAEASRYGSATAQAAAWAPDGKTLAVATSLGVDLFDAQTFALLDSWETGLSAEQLAYSPDGSLLALGGPLGQVQVWQTAAAKQLYTLTGGQEGVGVLAFSPDGSLFMAGNYGSTIYRWDMATGELLALYPGYIDGVTSLDFSPDGQFLLTSSPGMLRLRSLASKELVYPPLEVNSASAFFTPDGKSFVTVGYDSPSDFGKPYQITIRYFDTASGKQQHEYAASKDIVYATAVSPDLRWIVTGGLEGMSIYSTAANFPARAPENSRGRVQALAFSPDGARLASIGDSAGVQVWDIEKRTLLQEVGDYMGLLKQVILSPDGKLSAAASANNKVQIRETSSGKLLHELSGGAPMAFAPDSKSIVIGTGAAKESLDYLQTGNKYLIFVDVASAKRLPLKQIPCAGASSVAFSADGKTLAYAGQDCEIQVRDILAEHPMPAFRANQTGWIEWRVALSPNGRLLAAAGGGRAMVWEIASHTLLNEIGGVDYDSQPVFSPDSRYLAYIGTGGVHLRELASNLPAGTLDTSLDQVDHLVFSPDGQVLLAAGNMFQSGDSVLAQVEIWDPWYGELASKLGLNADRIAGMGVSADGQILLTASTSGLFQTWRVKDAPPAALAVTRAAPTPQPTLTPTPVYTPIAISKLIALGRGPISPVSYSPDGSIAALMNGDTLRWYDPRTQAELGSMSVPDHWEADDVILSPNNRYAIVPPSIIDLETKTVIGRVYGGNGPTSGYVFTADSRYMAFLAEDRTTGGPYEYIGLLDLETGKDVGYDPYVEDGWRFKTLNPDNYHSMSAPAISPDDRFVAAGHTDNRVYVWLLASGERRFLLSGHAGVVTSVDFSPNGLLLASGSRDGTVRLWNMADGSLERVITGLQDDVRGIKFSADGQDLQIAVSGQSVQVYNLARRSLRSAAASASETPDPFTLALHRQGYISRGRYHTALLVFSPDGRRLAQVSGNVLIWDAVSHELVASLETPDWTNLREAVFSPDGASLAAVSSDGDIWVWSALTGEKILSLSKADLTAAQADPASAYFSVQGLAFSPDGRALLLGRGTQMELWDIHSGARLQTLEQVQPPAIPSQVRLFA